MIGIHEDVVVRPLLVETKDGHAYFCLIDKSMFNNGIPCYYNINQFLRFNTYHRAAAAKDKRALRQLFSRFVICGGSLHRRTIDGALLLFLDRDSVDR